MGGVEGTEGGSGSRLSLHSGGLYCNLKHNNYNMLIISYLHAHLHYIPHYVLTFIIFPYVSVPPGCDRGQ